MWLFRRPSLGKAHAVLMQIHGQSEQTMWFPRRSRFLYKQPPFFDGLCYTPLSTFFPSLTVSEFVHDEALGFDRHYAESVW